MNINYYDLYYTMIKNRDEKEIINDDEYEKDYIIFDDFIALNRYIGRQKNKIILR